MQGCCRGRCAGSVADIGCRIVAGVAVQEALRTSDARLLPESLCRRRCGRRMQDCCRSRCAGSVADVGCRIVAGVAVQEALRTSDAGLLLDGLLPVFVA